MRACCSARREGAYVVTMRVRGCTECVTFCSVVFLNFNVLHRNVFSDIYVDFFLYIKKWIQQGGKEWTNKIGGKGMPKNDKNIFALKG